MMYVDTFLLNVEFITDLIIPALLRLNINNQHAEQRVMTMQQHLTDW